MSLVLISFQIIVLFTIIILGFNGSHYYLGTHFRVVGIWMDRAGKILKSIVNSRVIPSQF